MERKRIMINQDTLKIVQTIITGMELTCEDQKPIMPSDLVKIINALCTVVGALLSSQDNLDIMDSINKIKDFQKKIEKENILKTIRKANDSCDNLSSLLNIEPDELLKRIKDLNIAEEVFLEALKKTNFNHFEASKLFCITVDEFSNLLDKDDEYRLCLALNYDSKINFFQCVKKFSLEKILKNIEHSIIMAALERTKGKKIKAAELLGITFRSLRHRMNLLKDFNNNSQYLSKAISTNYLNKLQNMSLDDFLMNIERKALVEVLEETKNKKTLAAEKLCITFRSLRHRLQRYQISI